jgi:hypothetical protein
MKAILFACALIIGFAPAVVFGDPSLIIKDLPKSESRKSRTSLQTL